MQASLNALRKACALEAVRSRDDGRRVGGQPQGTALNSFVDAVVQLEGKQPRLMRSMVDPSLVERVSRAKRMYVVIGIKTEFAQLDKKNQKNA